MSPEHLGLLESKAMLKKQTKKQTDRWGVSTGANRKEIPVAKAGKNCTTE